MGSLCARLRKIFFFFRVQLADERKISERIFSRPQNLFYHRQDFVQRSISHVSICRDNEFPRMLYFSKCTFKHVDLIIILIGMYLIQNQASGLFSIFGFRSACIVFQLRPGLEIRDQLFCNAEFSFKLFLFADIVSNFESFVRLIFRIRLRFYVIFQRRTMRLKEIRQRYNKSILSVSSSHHHDEFLKQRHVVNVHKSKRINEFLVRKKWVIIILAILQTFSVGFFVKKNIVSLQSREYDVLD